MGYVIGQIKTPRTTLALEHESIDSPIVSVSGGTLDTVKYDDITSIENWDRYGNILCTDILQTRDRIRNILDEVKWSGLTNIEKDIVIDYYLKESDKDDSTSDMEKVQYLMGKGYSLLQAQGFLIKAYGDYHIKEIYACTKRANAERLYEIIAKYLTLTDASDLIKISHKLFDLYKTQAIRGTRDGNAGEGLFDFLESTVGTSYETSGLAQQGYVLKTGNNDSFISELMDVLRKGNY